jgi:DUF1680 family protein
MNNLVKKNDIKKMHVGSQLQSAFFRNLLNVLIVLITLTEVNGQTSKALKVKPSDVFIAPYQVSEKGILGQEIGSSLKGRLFTLPGWREGELIKMFSEEARNKNKTTDWYGEHAGKWMYTTALAVKRTSDNNLKKLLLQTADYLISTQGSDGYLGSYSKALRITNPDSKVHARSWDVWSLTYMTLGLLEVNKISKDSKYLNAAKRIGELFLKTFGDGKANVTDYGTRHGISATIMLEAVVELYKATIDEKYLNFAQLILKEMEDKEGVRFIRSALNNRDLEHVGDGKAYQIIWNLLSIVKLYEITGNGDYLKAVENNWQNIMDYHLTITGGPWGGIGKHYECFNAKNFWSPYGFVETCSIMSWIQFNKELLLITGDAKYAQQIENSSYNALIGAKYKNGENWAYHSFTNGRRHVAHFNDCCPSSGALALEEVSSVIYSLRENGIACNLYTDSKVTIPLAGSLSVNVNQETDYPFNGKIKMAINPSKRSKFPIFIRIPSWANNVSVNINGEEVDTKSIGKNTFLKIERIWNVNDIVNINFPLELNIVQKSEYAKVPQGNDDIFRINWFGVTVGPLVYATNGLLNGKDRESSFQFPLKDADALFKKVVGLPGFRGNAYQLLLPEGKPLIFVPYYEADKRTKDEWRMTWLQNKISE